MNETGLRRIPHLRPIILAVVILFGSAELKAIGEDRQRYEFTVPMMGTRMDLVLYADSKRQAQSATDACLNEIQRLSRIVSNYDPESEISLLCQSAYGEPFEVSHDLRQILVETERWHRLSGGKFDVTVGPLTSIWRSARKQKRAPNAEDIASARTKIGFEKIDFSPSTNETAMRFSRVRFKVEGMQLDLSGLATGYIIDRAVERMRASGVHSFLINIGGDICLGDAPPGQQGWRVDIGGLSELNRPFCRLITSNCSVTSSGDLYQFMEIDGRRYSHFIDPTSATPIERRQSVTVVASTTIDADAGATAIAIIGFEAAMDLLPCLPLKGVYWLEAPSESHGIPRFRYLEP